MPPLSMYSRAVVAASIAAARCVDRGFSVRTMGALRAMSASTSWAAGGLSSVGAGRGFFAAGFFSGAAAGVGAARGGRGAGFDCGFFAAGGARGFAFAAGFAAGGGAAAGA